jgi:hypothetical protein
MDVGIIIAATVCIQLVQIRREFGPQGQQFLPSDCFFRLGDRAVCLFR